ncbi:hypothetical protein UPYG_G00291950 [Umbra pygmaea]|uniref:PHLPP-like RA domain-containing protein n=1 Tax=Umbra pygmaea TaxID=75934 RepID=A0ABD0WU94_UMBPY
MESARAVVHEGLADESATKFMKPSGLSAAEGTPVDDGGGHSVASRLDIRNGNDTSPNAVGSCASNKSNGNTSGRSLSSNSNALLLRRRRLKRNLSAAAATTATSAVNAACGAKMNSALSSASLHTRSLDRKTLLRHRQNMQLQPSDREWVRGDLHRGSIHVHDKLTSPSYPRPVLCTMDTTAGEIALRMSKLGSKSNSVLRIFCKDNLKTDQNGNCNLKYAYDSQYKLNRDISMKCNHSEPPEFMRGLSDHPSDRLRLPLGDERQKQQDLSAKLFTPESDSQDNVTHSSDLNSNSNLHTPNEDDSDQRLNGVDSYGLNSGSDVESSSAFDDLSSSGARLSEHRDSLSDDMILGTDASILSPTFDSATEGHDTYGSSSDELELDCPTASIDPILPKGNTTSANYTFSNGGHLNNVTPDAGSGDRVESICLGSLPPSSTGCSLSRACSTVIDIPAIKKPDNRPDSLKKGSTAVDQDKDVAGDTKPTLYVQLHGEAVRRLGQDERPLQIQHDFLFKLGFKDPWRVQEEGINTEIGSLLRFYAGKTHLLNYFYEV